MKEVAFNLNTPVPDATEKKPPKKGKKAVKKRRKAGKKTLILYGVLLILFIALAIYFIVTMLFNVDRITVIGNSIYENSDIIKTSGIEKGDNLFDIDIVYAEDKIYSVYPYADEVKVQRKFPNGVEINITEAVAYTAVEESDGYTLLSQRGKVLERGLDDVPYGIPIVRGFSTVTKTEDDTKRFELLRTITALMEKMELKGYDLIDLSDTLDIYLICENRIKIRLGNELEMEYKLQFAESVRREKLDPTGYFLVDASIPGEVRTKELSVSPWDVTEKYIGSGFADEDEE